MKCTNPRMKKLVYLYQLDSLTEQQAISVEAHLMECQACLEELYHVSPVLEILEAMPDDFLDALQSQKSFISQTTSYLKQNIDSINKIITSAFSIVALWWRRPAIKFLAPLLAAVLIMIMIIPKSSIEYSDLAIIAKAPYLSLRLRQPDELSQAKRLFDEGMLAYEMNDYSDAIHQLDSLLIQQPHDAEGNFYRGVCLLLTGNVEDGIKNLQVASELSLKQNNKLLLERCYWYLGNAYLKMNDEKNALEEFNKIVLLGKNFEEDARNQIIKIEERKNKSKN